VVVTGVVSVLTGRLFLFPSPGPSAYLLATAPTVPTSQPLAGALLVATQSLGSPVLPDAA